MCREMKELKHCKKNIIYNMYKYLEQHLKSVVVLTAYFMVTFNSVSYKPWDP